MDMSKMPEDSESSMVETFDDYIKARLKRMRDAAYAHQWACCGLNCPFCKKGYPLGTLPAPGDRPVEIE